MKEFTVLTKDDLGLMKHKEHCFISFAESGAMGMPGEVQVITAGGYAYSCNCVYGDVKWEDVEEVLPVLAESSFGMFGLGSVAPKGWNYLSMRAGNHLLVSDMVYSDFMKILGRGLRESQVYANWIGAAWKVISAREDKMCLDKAYDILCDFYDDFETNVENEEFSKEYVEAMEYIIKMENDPDVILGLGSYYYVIKDYDKALELYKRATDMNFEPAYECLGYLYHAMLEKVEDDIEQETESFGDRFFRLVDDKKTTDATIYKRANVDRRVISKLRANPDKRISKETAISLILALELPQSEAEEMLKLAGYALSPRFIFDRIILNNIKKGNYDVNEINAQLYDKTKRTLRETCG